MTDRPSRHRPCPRGRSRRRCLIAVLASALVLVACSGQLPITPQPQAGLPVSVQTRPDVERFLTPPQPGASPSDVVRGFLQTNVGFADDGDVARSYLTGELASQWVPTQEVLVYEGTPEVVSSDSSDVTVNVEVAGRIDEAGRLVEQSANATTSQTFTLSRVGGEWRISTFPEGFGVWLSRGDLEQSFRSTVLYYLNEHGHTFVPEVRWLAYGDGRPTSLVRAQLDPLPDHLQGAVRTAASDGVRLSAASVPVDPTTGVAVVSLTGPGLATDGEPNDALQSQLAHALLSLSGVSGVQLQLEGQPMTLGGEDQPITASTELPYHDVHRNVDLVLLRVGERFTPVDPAVYDLPDLPAERAEGLPRLGLSWTGVAASADLRDFAAVSTSRTALWRWQDGVEHTNKGIGDGLTPPATDPLGGFWIGGVGRSTGTPRVWVVDREEPAAAALPIETPWLGERDRVEMLSISPDGSRAVLLLGDTGSKRHRLVLAGVERDAEDRAVALTPGVAVAPTLIDVRTARWASVGDLYLVGQRGDDPRMRAYSLRLGEWLTPMGSRDALTPVEVLAVPRGAGAEPIARTADGRFHTTEGSQGWGPARNGDEIVVPGS